MSITVDCTSCGLRLKAPDQAAGKKAKCPKCGHSISIQGRSAKAAAVHRKPAIPPCQQQSEANPEEMAAALLLEGNATPSPLSGEAASLEEPDDGAADAPPAWEPAGKARKLAKAAESDRPVGKSRKSAIFWAVGAVAAVALLTGAFFIFRSHMAAEADRQSQEEAAQQEAAQQNADRERASKEQLAHQQQFVQAALEEKRRREEAETRLAQLESEQKEAEQERTRKEQLAREEDERKRQKDDEAKAQQASENQTRLNSDLKKLARLNAEKAARLKLAEHLLKADPSELADIKRGLTVMFEAARGKDLKSYSVEDRRLCFAACDLWGEIPIADYKNDKTVEELVRLMMGPLFPESGK